ncbi:MAG: M90 family metallopeptidase, partial [Ginsengibacter sp.]
DMTIQLAVFIFSLFLIGGFLFAVFRKKPVLKMPVEGTEQRILEQDVLFYQRLSSQEKIRFEENIKAFLQKVRITGVKTEVSDSDRIFVAAAAVIPIFSFKGWAYRNIHEVLLYPGSFNHDYSLEGADRNLSGMVGNGPMQNIMLLSQQDLRSGFLNHTDTSNTAIHEFVHLVDKSDGSTDGIPENLLPQKYVLPFLSRIHEEIQQIKSHHSDINPYGATSEAEFLAVAAEYFFQRPEMMEKNHPELFRLLEQVFTTPS